MLKRASEQTKKRPPKTLKERTFVKEYIKNGGNGTQAALKVYNTKSYGAASIIAVTNKRQLLMPDLMEEMGVTDAHLVQALKDGLEATKRVSGLGSTEAVFDPDHSIRHKYLETGLKLKGHMKNEDANVNNFNFFLKQKELYEI